MPDKNQALHRAVLVLPHLRVQNANAISSPLTWGFPSITAFTGLMTALERRVGQEAGIAFYRVGVVCHAFEAQVTQGGFTRAFHLTRNPVLANGQSAAIVEEGRVHLELTLVFDVEIGDAYLDQQRRQVLAEQIADVLAGMRLAGGSLMPPLPGTRQQVLRPVLELIPDTDAEEDNAQANQFRRLARRWLPGFALVSRDDLLHQHLQLLRAEHPDASVLDAWLDLSRWNSHAVEPSTEEAVGSTDKNSEKVVWQTDVRSGWIVPIPIGYAALTDLQPAGSVRGARDQTTPFRFVETLWSLGQWISPHRLQCLEDLFWDDAYQPAASALYRCRNNHRPVTEQPVSAT